MSTPYVLTLIAQVPGGLNEDFCEQVQDNMRDAGAHALTTDWLADELACDIFFHGHPEKMEEAIQPLLHAARMDCAVQAAAGRRKQLLISDMDSTMITVECIDELADFAGLKHKVSVITEKAMNGELDFKAALTERVALLAGLPEAVLQEAYDSRVSMMPGAKTLVATMKKHGAYCLLVSGGFTFFTSRVRAALGFDEDSSNVLEVENGVLTGRVIPPILDKEAKLASLHSACKHLSINPTQVLAVGDGANDLPMIEAAGLGVAYRGKELLRAHSKARVDHCDLTALLYMQGYKQNEMVA